MKTLVKSLTAAGLAGAAFTAVPAAAQVNGIATSSPEAVIVSAQARINAYQQISTTYAANIDQAKALRTELEKLQTSLDSNKDGQLTQQEINANPAVVKQAQQKEQEIAKAIQPITLAQTYAIEQLINDYQNARTTVIQAKGIQLMLDPSAIQYAPDSIDVTKDIVAALNKRMPSVQTTPPANWRPRGDSYAMQQQVQQILIAAARRAASQQQAEQPQTEQPSSR